MIRQPFWADYVLIVISGLISGALFSISTILWSVRHFVRRPDARRLMVPIMLVIYALCGLLIVNIIARILFVSHVVARVSQQFVMAQIVMYAAAAIVSMWLWYEVLRHPVTRFIRGLESKPPDDDDDDQAAPPGGAPSGTP